MLNAATDLSENAPVIKCLLQMIMLNPGPAMDPDWSRSADSFYDFIHAAKAVASTWEAEGLVVT